jgi:phosphohistidine phosphatase SixA
MMRCWLSLALFALAVPACADDALWSLLQKGGQIVLVRHGLAGPGHAREFKPGECATQRNLESDGRRQAESLGAALRAHKVPVARVLSSPWCDCVETARIAFGAQPEIDEMLSDLLHNPASRDQQVAQFRTLVPDAPKQGNLFLVTHRSTTAAFTGINQGIAEMVIVTPEGGERYRVAGRLPVPRLPVKQSPWIRVK